MESIDDDAGFRSPNLQRVMAEIFDISETELAVCRILMEQEEATVNELHDEFDRDRSIIIRHLNHLVDVGVVEKKSRVLDEGGRINVYSPKAAEEIRRQFYLGLFAWMGETADLIDELSQEKIEAMAEQVDAEESARPEAGTNVENAGADTEDDEGSLIGQLLGRDSSR